MRCRFILVVICLFSYWVHAQKTPFTLAERFDSRRRSISETPPMQLLGNKHVVFVAGIMNELANLISNYFPDNIEAAQDMGASTSYVAPRSSGSIPKNAGWLYSQVKTIYADVKRPLILVGHSKGGAEILHLILDHPELILDGTVDTVLLLQSAIGGSPLAYETGPWITLVSLFLSPDIETLKPHNAKRNFDRAYVQFCKTLRELVPADNGQQAKKAISNRIFYVRSQQDPIALSSGVGFVLKVWQKSLGNAMPNDGLLPTSSQLDLRIGVDLGILAADHIDLAVSKVSVLSKQDRKAFMYAVMEHIYESNS
jgi:hypothetical protein